MKLLGIGSYTPALKRNSAEYDADLSLPVGRVETLTGVNARFVCTGEEDQINMGVAAAQAALNDAGLTPADIDLVISAAAVPYQPIPATAPAYQAALGIADGGAFSFDVNATCLSFITALDVCASLISRGSATRALIISSEVASRALPWANHPEIAGLFGDGAAAVVVEDGGEPLVTRFETHPSGYEICQLAAGGTRFDLHADKEAFFAHSLFDMDGRALFRLTAQRFGPFVEALLADAGWSRAEVDLVVPHQASPMALQHMVRHCGFEAHQAVDISRSHGNQVAASVSYALAHARNRLKPGARILLLGTSAGVSFGGAALTLP